MMWIVHDGEAQPFTPEGTDGLHLDQYGSEWVLVEAADGEDAVAQALAYDRHQHPAQTEMEVFREIIRGLESTGDPTAEANAWVLLHQEGRE